MKVIKNYIQTVKDISANGKVIMILACCMVVLGLFLKSFFYTAIWIFILLVYPSLQRRELTGNKYGVLYFEDGKALSLRGFLQMSEADKACYIGKTVTVKFPFYRIDAQGDLDTGFDVYFLLGEWQKADHYGAATLKSLKVNDPISASGTISRILPASIYIELEKLERLENNELIV